jgi:hypothetical protein
MTQCTTLFKKKSLSTKAQTKTKTFIKISDALYNKYELVFNEWDDAASLKNLPIDDTMHDII